MSSPRCSVSKFRDEPFVETLKYYGFGLGTPRPWAQYAPRIVEPPQGSEVIEEWKFFLGLAQRMGIDMKIMTSFRAGGHAEGASLFMEIDRPTLRRPSRSSKT